MKRLINIKIRFIHLKFVIKRLRFKHILNLYHTYKFQKSLYQNTKLGEIFYVVFYKRTFRVNSHSHQDYIHSNVKEKIQDVCLLEKEGQSVPTVVSIMYLKECQQNV